MVKSLVDSTVKAIVRVELNPCFKAQFSANTEW
jgi:hypothetical protein